MWQPIETAPKDGTEVLLFYPEMQTAVRVGYWYHSVTTMNGKVTSDSAHWSADPTLGFWLGEKRKPILPSHWMPLPAAPEAT
jgi:hypothetical protein